MGEARSSRKITEKSIKSETQKMSIVQPEYGKQVVERPIHTMINLIIADMEDGQNLIESVNRARALKRMRCTVHT